MPTETSVRMNLPSRWSSSAIEVPTIIVPTTMATRVTIVRTSTRPNSGVMIAR